MALKKYNFILGNDFIVSSKDVHGRTTKAFPAPCRSWWARCGELLSVSPRYANEANLWVVCINLTTKNFYYAISTLEKLFTSMHEYREYYNLSVFYFRILPNLPLCEKITNTLNWIVDYNVCSIVGKLISKLDKKKIEKTEITIFSLIKVEPNV